jgi:hypothetical protein
MVMARKRRAPKYAGALAQPIYVEDHYKFTGGLGQPIWEPDIAAIKKRGVEKIWLLFKHYKIDPSDEHIWQELALSLAFEHVPGLQLANRPKSGRPKTGLYDELVRAVDDKKSRTGLSTRKAIAELRKEGMWKTYPSGKPIPAQSLEARYREARARQKALALVEEALRKDWEKGIFFRPLRLPRRRRSGGLKR